MTKVIPNELTKLIFAPSVSDLAAPTVAELTAGKDITALLISLNASTQGNTVPTPSLDTLFETSIPGTVQASFTADFYRDDEKDKDVAWTTLPRRTKGVMVLARFGFSGADNTPVSTDSVECWPIIVTSRSMANTSSGSVQTFSVNCSVPEEPAEDAVVSA